MTSLLTIRGLTKNFGGLSAVHRLEMQIEPGEIHSLVGPNGAGKTTVFNLISGILVPELGQILYGNSNLVGRSPHQIARLGIGRTFQVGRVFRRMACLENVMVGRHARSSSSILAAGLDLPSARREERSIRAHALQELGFVHLEKRANDQADTLPHGHERLLEIGRAIASEPRLLLLDEPAAGLNTEETQGLQGLILRLRERGITILLVEHDMRLVMGISDRITVMAEGRKIAEGTPNEIQAHPRVIEAYLGTRRRIRA